MVKQRGVLGSNLWCYAGYAQAKSMVATQCTTLSRLRNYKVRMQLICRRCGVQTLLGTRHRLLSISISCVLLVPIFGCGSKGSQQMIEQDFLQNNLNIGQILLLSSITKATSGTVCALYPYQPYVAEGVPESARINAHLKATDYTPDESHWAIVVVQPEAVDLSNFKRSEKLDILASHEIKPEHRRKLPEGFEPANCSSLQKAAITKIESQGRKFLVIGEIK